MRDRKTFRVAFCGVMAGAMAALMLVGTLIPLSTYIAPMLAGALAAPVVWELGAGSGWLLYAAVSLLSLFLATDKEAALLYVLLLVTSFFPKSWRIRGLGRRADPTVALPATGGMLADYRLTIPSMMIFLSLWGVLGIPGPGWIVPAVMFVLILLPLARFLLRVYVLHR